MGSEKRRIAGAIFLLFLAGVSIATLVGTYSARLNGAQTETFVTLERTKPSAETGQTSEETLPVYLVGAVENPGIYNVKSGIYLYELLDQAGGLSADAAEDRINLVYCIRESRILRIPTLEEMMAAAENDEGLEGLVEESGFPGQTERVDKVDINRADESVLDSLPGVGPATARAIIDYREKYGPFACIEEIMGVPGIKESRFEALRDRITAG